MEIIGEKTLLDIFIEYRSPIIAIGSCFAKLVCDAVETNLNEIHIAIKRLLAFISGVESRYS